ncbi:M15 family metallopeptidase [Blautia schinkii]|nr:M15 family metallopeptidase [Blautia schinkii]
MNFYTRLINREHPLPEGYIPEHLIDIGIPFDAVPGDPKRLLEVKTARAAHNLITQSRREGLNLYGISGYRSFQRQKELYTGSPYVAAPGTSEHQSGLALDLSCPQIGMELTDEFASTPEGIWLSRNASLYGFILRYPKNKEQITQVPYEPWHIRYVTKPLAAYLALTGMTLEEFHCLRESKAEIR